MKSLLLILAFPVFAGELSIKNFRSIYESLQVSMNLTPAPGSFLQAQYELTKKVLPSTGSVKEYNASMQWALWRLTSEFCRKRIQMDELLDVAERWVHKQIDFKVSPKKQNDIQLAVEEYTEVFWQRSSSDVEKATISELIQGLIADLPDESKSLKPFLTSICTVIGTSISTLLID